MRDHRQEILLPLLVPPPLGNVPRHRDVDRPGRQVHRRRPHLDGDESAVLAAQVEFPAPHAALLKGRVLRPGSLPRRRHHIGDGQAKQFVVRVSQHCDGGGVRVEVSRVGVGDQDRVRGVLEEGAEAGLGSLRVAIQPGVVDGDGRAPRQLLGEGEVVGAVEPFG